MKRHIIAVLCAAALTLSLCGCDLADQVLSRIPLIESTDPAGPGKMVQQVAVVLHPADPDFDRLYRSQDTLDELLKLIREMENSNEPESQPDLHDGQSYYAITATYASGESQVYYLLGHRYLKVGDNPWCIITTEQSMRIIGFLQEHPSEDPSHSSYETTPPSEDTAPTGSEATPSGSEIPTGSAET